MPYKAVFVGLIDFFNMQEEPLLLMPDGRNPGPDIDPHFAGVFVHEDQVNDGSGWWEPVPDEKLNSMGIVQFRVLEPSWIAISGQDGTGSLDVSAFNDRVPQLTDFSSGTIAIDPGKAETIAQIPIRRGTLRARLLGGTAIIGDLAVADHEGPVTITATPLAGSTFGDGSAQKVLVLNELPASDLAKGRDRFFIANFSNKNPDTTKPEASHFLIYGKLHSGDPIDPLTSPTDGQVQALGAPVFISSHPFATHLGGFKNVGGGQCTITTCCTKPKP
jgi:hypothetical protein